MILATKCLNIYMDHCIRTKLVNNTQTRIFGKIIELTSRGKNKQQKKTQQQPPKNPPQKNKTKKNTKETRNSEVK